MEASENKSARSTRGQALPGDGFYANRKQVTGILATYPEGVTVRDASPEEIELAQKSEREEDGVPIITLGGKDFYVVI